MQIRRFSSDMQTTVPGNHVGLSAVPILLGRAIAPSLDTAQMAARFHGMPTLIDGAASVAALYFAPHARMEEHSNPRNTLCLVLRGAGWLRIGGPEGETQRVQAGDAVLWPPEIDHMLWTEDAELDAIVIELPLPSSTQVDFVAARP
jgi:quercetin dioxygenase-like cupin family protein